MSVQKRLFYACWIVSFVYIVCKTLQCHWNKLYRTHVTHPFGKLNNVIRKRMMNEFAELFAPALQHHVTYFRVLFLSEGCAVGTGSGTLKRMLCGDHTFSKFDKSIVDW